MRFPLPLLDCRTGYLLSNPLIEYVIVLLNYYLIIYRIHVVEYQSKKDVVVTLFYDMLKIMK